MRSLWLPSLVAAFFLAVSVSFISYGWHLHLTLPVPRGGLEIGQILGLFVLGIFLLIGSTGYLCAVPGLEMGENGFRPKLTTYGIFVGGCIGSSRSSCGAGYAFGFTVYGALFGLTIILGLVAMLVHTSYSGFAELRDEVTFEGVGIIVTLFIVFLLLFFGIPKLWNWMKSKPLYLTMCPPREFTER